MHIWIAHQQTHADDVITIVMLLVVSDTVLEHWKERAESMLRQCESQPACMAVLLDQWADMLQAADKPASPQQGQAGQQQDMVVPAPLLGWLAERIGDLLQDTFLVFLDEPGSQLAQESVTNGRQVDVHVGDPHLKVRGAGSVCRQAGSLVLMLLCKDHAGGCDLVYPLPAAFMCSAGHVLALFTYMVVLLKPR